MTKMRSGQMPVADMQWQAQKIAKQAAKLADQARPITAQATIRARRSAKGAAQWAAPKVGMTRGWLAKRAARGSVSVQETVAPRVSAMLAATARKLDPPVVMRRTRRWPKVVAGLTLLAAAGTAAAAYQVRKSTKATIPPPKPPAQAKGKKDTGDPSVKVLNPSAEQDFATREAEMDGISRTR